MPIYQPLTTSALFADSRKSNHQGPCCTYCKRSDPSVKCNVVTDISTRRQLLRQKGKCFRCQRSGHLANRCSKNVTYVFWVIMLLSVKILVKKNNQFPEEEVQSLMKELHSTLVQHRFKLHLPVCLSAPNPVSFYKQREQTSASQGVMNILSMPEWCLIVAVKEATSQRTYRALRSYLKLARTHH